MSRQRWRLVWYFFVLIVCWINLTFASLGEHDIPDDWVDPTDMLNFDYGSKTNKKSSDSVRKESNEKLEVEQGASAIENEAPVQSQAKQEEYGQTSVRIEKENGPSKFQGVKAVERSSCDNPFLRRFISVLYKKIERVGYPPRIEEFEVRVRLKETAWNSLKSYGQNCGANVQEVTAILESMIKEVHIPIEATDSWTTTFEDIFHIQFQDALKVGIVIFLVVAALSLEVISRISWSVQIRRLMILAFLISIPLTYIHEIKLAEAEYKSKATGIPKECQGDRGEPSTWESVKGIYQSWFSVEEDPCVKYHKDFLVTPHIKVTPTKVLAVTLTRFAVEPLEHVGSAFSKAFKNIFAGLPVTLWVPAFLFVILVILGFLLIVAVCFGYNFSFNLPFWAGLQMGPQQAIHHNPHMDQVLADNRQHIDQLQATIRELRERPQQQALTAPPVTSRSPVRAILNYFGRGSPPSEPNLPPPAPPYPGPEPDLPYPQDLGPPLQPHYDPPNRRRAASHGGFSPTSDTCPETPGQSILRRRKTDADIRRETDAENDLPYPDPTRGEAAASARGDRNYIGFERIMEREERDITDPGRLKISRQAGGEPAPAGYDAVINPVEVVPQRPRRPQNNIDTTEVKQPKASPKLSPPKYADTARHESKASEDTATKPRPRVNSSKPMLQDSSKTEKVPSQEAKFESQNSAFSQASVESSLGGEENQIETLGDRDGLGPDGGIEAEATALTASDAGLFAMEDWEKVSMELNCSHGPKCGGNCENFTPKELMEVFQREAEQGISLSSLK